MKTFLIYEKFVYKYSVLGKFHIYEIEALKLCLESGFNRTGAVQAFFPLALPVHLHS